MSVMHSHPLPRRHTAVLVLTVALGLLACMARWRSLENDTAPHRWWQERGPVVPHEDFPADCGLCHEGGDWYSIRDDFEFDHHAETGVALEGSHERAECLRCHNDRGPVALYAQRGCRGCHEDIHRGQLGSECSTCHDERTWRPNEIVTKHNLTRFPLVGAHAAAGCWTCHPGAEVGNFTRVDTECATCHMSDLARATNPDHQAMGFTDSCDRCHIPTTWTGAGFSHPGFPLTGAHRSLACEECHVGGVFTSLPTDCFSCHMDDYNGATDHLAGNFPTECQQCHNTTAWMPANFNHAGISMGCDTCHLDDYLGTDDPDHQAAGFPTSCEQCHNTNRWDGANFDHSFPIAGPHDRDCIDCHLIPNNFNTFSCTHCHEHRQSRMDDEHDDEDGYVWESNACLACHPNGRE
jgi:hypothetical protein